MLYKTPVPLEFLVPPFAFLYVRAVLRQEATFRKSDLWHAIPFVLGVINYASFYIIPFKEKKAIVADVIAYPDNIYFVQDGLLPEWLVLIVQLLLFYGYLVAQWYIIIQHFKVEPSALSKQFLFVKKWLYDFVKLQTFYTTSLVLVYVASSLLVFADYKGYDVPLILTTVLMAVSFLFLSGYLLWNPEVLIGLPQLSKKSSKKALKNSLETDAYIQKIKEQRLFLQPNINLSSVALQLGVSPRKLSASIDKAKYSNFNDFINYHRVLFAKDLIEEQYLNRHSIEALSQASGFHSKNAFYRAFKKEFGCTPKAYHQKEDATSDS
ncbi:helix-turn-helix transcriptional regulator [Croceitalea sp. P059]|uniref:helix-turn-helix domain-containing protein n=1 Tax=Croceitalea sp. P059 TaxID=3075601 RepID=UPI0028865E5F|nr:helix-turn-helix transcriptional regulator [Croceitalea sp. P059]MDT0538853.1 helix-turn-helix transcriptional regulator [Croceitalea sp. P059]